MKLTIKNITNIKTFNYINDKIKVDDVSVELYMYQFYFTHSFYGNGFIYVLHRDLTDGINGSNNRYVGTFRHPNGSHRQDVHEADLLDKDSFRYFLDTLVNDWAVMHNQ